MTDKIYKVMIVEPNKSRQNRLQQMILEDNTFSLVGIAISGEEAIRLAKETEPNVIILTMKITDCNPFELINELVNYEIPVIVIFCSIAEGKKAVELGAKDYIPIAKTGEKNTDNNLELMLKMKVKMALLSRGKGAVNQKADKGESSLNVKAPVVGSVSDKKNHIILIGASLGGTEITLNILRQLPDNMPGIVVVQHMSVGFTESYANRLDKNCKLTVREAKTGDVILPNTVLVAPAGKQTRIYRNDNTYRVRCTKEEKYGGFLPSVDVLFHSAAENVGENMTAVILTGMGRDGATGLKEIHNVGAYTIGQSRESCVVYGMPAAAESLGAVDVFLSPNEIAQLLIKRCSF